MSPLSADGIDGGMGSRVFSRSFPQIRILRGYRRSWLAGDAVAGITVAAYLVPQVMAYAGLAGLPPVAGLWAMAPAIVLYASWGPHGGCRWGRSRRPR